MNRSSAADSFRRRFGGSEGSGITITHGDRDSMDIILSIQSNGHLIRRDVASLCRNDPIALDFARLLLSGAARPIVRLAVVDALTSLVKDCREGK